MAAPVLSSPEFFAAVRMLRAMPERYQHYALYMARFWSAVEIAEAEHNGDVPGRPGELPPAQLQ